jgi:type VI secretion system secreted protein VgrG
MGKQQLKPTLLVVVVTALVAACSAGNSTPAVPGQGSAAFASSASLGRSASPIRPATAFVDLRSATRFAILAGSTVTNTGPTKVVGNVGLSPGVQ